MRGRPVSLLGWDGVPKVCSPGKILKSWYGLVASGASLAHGTPEPKAHM